jgi:3-hydroxyacyl-[acyl-carrier-protein] dehydratase
MNELRREISKAAQGEMEIVGPDKAIRRYCFPSHFIGFSGHFPEYPVLPAFVQVLSALMVIEEWKGRPLQLFAIERAKFHIEVKPDQEMTITCREYEAKGTPAIEAKLSVAEGLAAVFHITGIECPPQQRCKESLD